MGESEVLFKLFGVLDVTGEVVTSWVIIALVVLFAFIGTRKLKDTPGFLQNILEVAIIKLENFFGDTLGEKSKRLKMCFPFLATMFIFIIISNYSGLIPGAGEFSWFHAPTSSLSVTAGLGIVTFCALHFFGFRTHKIHYLKHFVLPVFFMLPFLIIDEIVRPVSLALRLYGNVFGEEMVTEQLYEIIPIGAPIIMMVLSLLFCALQAIVFTMLTSIYIFEATEELE